MAIATVPVHRGQWIDLVLRMDIPTQRKTVAFALSRFANPDGSRVFPGQGKVANMAKLHETTAHKHIRALERAGLLAVVKRGGGRGGATNTYQLTRPADITTLPLWLDPDMNRVDDGAADGAEYQAPAPGENGSESQEQEAPAPDVSVDNSALGPVDNPETPSVAAGDSGPAEPEIPSVPARNTQRSDEKYQALALEDQPKTNPRPTQHPAGLRKATPSLALVPPIHNGAEAITEPEPPKPPADPDYAAARAVLAAMRRPVADAWRHAARTALETAGTPLDRRTVEIHAANLAARPPTAAGGAA